MRAFLRRSSGVRNEGSPSLGYLGDKCIRGAMSERPDRPSVAHMRELLLACPGGLRSSMFEELLARVSDPTVALGLLAGALLYFLTLASVK